MGWIEDLQSTLQKDPETQDQINSQLSDSLANFQSQYQQPQDQQEADPTDVDQQLLDALNSFQSDSQTEQQQPQDQPEEEQPQELPPSPPQGLYDTAMNWLNSIGATKAVVPHNPLTTLQAPGRPGESGLDTGLRKGIDVAFSANPLVGNIATKLIEGAGEQADKTPAERRPEGIIARAFDTLDAIMGAKGVMGAANVLADRFAGKTNTGFLQTVANAYKEGMAGTWGSIAQDVGLGAIPEYFGYEPGRRTGIDLIKTVAPDFARQHKFAADAGALLLDIAGTPGTYLDPVADLVELVPKSGIGLLPKGEAELQKVAKGLSTASTFYPSGVPATREMAASGLTKILAMLPEEQLPQYVRSGGFQMFGVPIGGQKSNEELGAMISKAVGLDKLDGFTDRLKDLTKLIGAFPKGGDLKTFAADIANQRNALRTAQMNEVKNLMAATGGVPSAEEVNNILQKYVAPVAALDAAGEQVAKMAGKPGALEALQQPEPLAMSVFGPSRLGSTPVGTPGLKIATKVPKIAETGEGAKVGSLRVPVKIEAKLPVEAAIATPYEYRRISTTKGIADKAWYHGTPTGIEGELSASYSDPNNLFGPGTAYLSDRPSVSQTYGNTIYRFKIKPKNVAFMDQGVDKDFAATLDSIVRKQPRIDNAPFGSQYTSLFGMENIEQAKRFRVVARTSGPAGYRFDATIYGPDLETAIKNFEHEQLMTHDTNVTVDLQHGVDEEKLTNADLYNRAANELIGGTYMDGGSAKTVLNQGLRKKYEALAYDGGLRMGTESHNAMVLLRPLVDEETHANILGQASPLGVPPAPPGVSNIPIVDKAAEVLVDPNAAVKVEAAQKEFGKYAARQIWVPSEFTNPLLVKEGPIAKAGAYVTEKTDELLPLEQRTRQLESIPGTVAEAFRTAFKQFANAPEAVAAFLHRQMIHMTNVADEGRQFAIDFFKGTSYNDRQQIGKIGYQITDAATAKYNELGRELTSEEEGDVLKQIYQGIKIWKPGDGKKPADAMSESAFNYLQDMMQMYRSSNIEFRKAGVLENQIAGYTHRAYSNIANPLRSFQMVRAKNPLWQRAFAGAAESRAFDSVKEAQALGFRPIFDAAQQMGLYLMDMKRAVAKKQTSDWLKEFYGVTSLADKPAFDAENRFVSQKEWDALKRGLAFIENPDTSLSANHPMMNLVNGAMRKLVGIFKFGATTARGPAFASKQIPQNFTQLFLRMGMGPQNIWGSIKALPMTLSMMMKEANNPFMEEAFKTGSGISRLNEKLTPQMLYAELKEIGALGGGYMGGERAAKSIRFALAKEAAIKKLQGVLPFSDKATEGWVKLLSSGSNILNWPPFVEDFYKAHAYNTLRMSGYGKEQAGKMMFEAMFDFSHGLSDFEKQKMKTWVMPFWSYTRFAAGLLGKTLFAHPGRILNLKKTIDFLLTAYNDASDGKELTTAQRHAIPDYILEQPSVYGGMTDQNKSRFFSFNNFSVLDFGDIYEEGQKGQTGVGRTMEKTILAKINPWLKWPVEFAVNRRFFQGDVINDPNRPGRKIGNVSDPDALIRNMVSAMGSNYGTIGVAAAQIFGEAAAKLTPEEQMKKLIGWERVQDPKTGEMVTYINPYLAHFVTAQYPAFQTAIRVTDESKSPAIRALQALLGVSVFDEDLQERGRQKDKAARQKLVDAKNRARTFARMGAVASYQKAMGEYQEMLAASDQEGGIGQ